MRDLELKTHKTLWREDPPSHVRLSDVLLSNAPACDLGGETFLFNHASLIALLCGAEFAQQNLQNVSRSVENFSSLASIESLSRLRRA